MMPLHDNLFAKPEQIQLVCCRALVHRCFEVGCPCTGDISESRVLSLLLPTESERDRFKYTDYRALAVRSGESRAPAVEVNKVL